LRLPAELEQNATLLDLHLLLKAVKKLGHLGLDLLLEGQGCLMLLLLELDTPLMMLLFQLLELILEVLCLHQTAFHFLRLLLNVVRNSAHQDEMVNSRLKSHPFVMYVSFKTVTRKK